MSHGHKQLSVILVSYNSLVDLVRFLPTLVAQNLEDLEVIVVDNNPGDGTSEWLKDNYPDIQVIPNFANTGYAGGNNLGIRCARAETILVLNPDTELHPGALQSLLDASKNNPDALITAKLLKPDGRVNACGNEMHYTGITTCKGLDDSCDMYKGLFEVPLLSGAAIIAPKAIFEALNGFDENYFMYFEDTDLSLRARLLGYQLRCNADATITHHYKLGMSASKFYYLERNRLLTLLSVYQGYTLFLIFPAIVLTALATWLFSVIKGPRFFVQHLKVYAWLCWHHALWRTKRREIQQKRTIDDRPILSGALASLPFGQLVSNPILAKVLHRLSSPIYRFIRPEVRV